jgi:hypothetical protein
MLFRAGVALFFATTPRATCDFFAGFRAVEEPERFFAARRFFLSAIGASPY